MSTEIKVKPKKTNKLKKKIKKKLTQKIPNKKKTNQLTFNAIIVRVPKAIKKPFHDLYLQ